MFEPAAVLAGNCFANLTHRQRNVKKNMSINMHACDCKLGSRCIHSKVCGYVFCSQSFWVMACKIVFYAVHASGFCLRYQCFFSYAMILVMKQRLYLLVQFIVFYVSHDLHFVQIQRRIDLKYQLLVIC